jgi:hypothetical protein
VALNAPASPDPNRGSPLGGTGLDGGDNRPDRHPSA